MASTRMTSVVLKYSRPQHSTKTGCILDSATRRISSLPSCDDDEQNCAVSPLSTVHRGTAFEHRAMHMLRDLSMSLSRIGGRNDGGIDLHGWWWLPFDSDSNSKEEEGPRSMTLRDENGIPRRRVRVLAQCKAERKKLGPNYVRELEGVLHRHFHASVDTDHPDSIDADAKTNIRTHHPTIALLVSESEFTKATTLCALSSPLPFFLLHLPRVKNTNTNTNTNTKQPETPSPESFASAVWNPPLGGQRGVLGGAIDLRWELSTSRIPTRRSPSPSPSRSRPSLWWHGTRLASWVPPSERIVD